MKKLSFLFIALVLVFTSCSTDDSPSIISGDIVGTWIGNTIDYSGDTVTTVDGQTLVADFVGEAYDMDYTITFSEDPNNVVSEGSYSLKLTYTVLGQTSVENVENIEFLEGGNWEQSNNILTLIAQEESIDYKIEELTDDKLVLSLSVEEDLSEQGVSIISTIDAKMTFYR